MPSVSNLLISLSYAILSVAVALGLRHFADLGLHMTMIAGVCTFLLGAQVQAAVGRTQDRKLLEDEIIGLQRGNLILGQEIELVRQQAEQKDTEIENSIAERSQKIIAEVRVLESLMRQLTEGLERKARSTALAAVEEAERAKATGDADAVAKLISSLENSLSEAETQEGGLRDSVLDSMSEEELLEVIRLSLNDNLVDLYLQPIVSIPGQEVTFYEALTRLRSHSGEMILPAQYLAIAEPAGLMSVIDNLLLFRCVQMVRRIAEQRASISIVCNISLSSIQDREFFPHFLEFMEINEDLSANLVFEFTQKSFEAFGDYEREKIDRLSELGFRMSLDGVTNLELDLPDLRGRNFRFIKVNSTLLINTLNTSDGEAQLQDFQELLGQFAIELILERIEEQALLDKAISINIGFGQGFLFGEPRPLEEVEARIQAGNKPSTLFDNAVADPDTPQLAYHRH